MRSSTTALIAAFVSAASATIYVTEPVSSTICTAGTPCNVRWNDDGTAPPLATIGACSIDLCTGNSIQQTCLQNISPSTDVSQNAYVTYNPDPTVGGNGDMWFVKFVSLAYMDPTNPQFHFTAYSAKFTLNGMTGTFNSTVQAEINAAASGVAAATTAAGTSAAATTTAAAANTMATVKASSTGSSSHSAASASSTAKKSGAAGPLTAPSVVSGVTGAGFFMSFMAAFFGMLAFGL